MKSIFPFELIHRFITCDRRTSVSPQCRVMRFESYDRASTDGKTVSKTRFNRMDEQWLKQQFVYLLPMTVHITGLLLLHLAPESFDHNITAKRKRIEDATSGDGVTTQQYVVPIYDTHHRDFVHFVPLYKELVFDLDVHDFDRFCDCATRKLKTLCGHCWLHIEGAYFIMRFILTHLFGYAEANILTVFSGGKGIHCFVNDARAMRLTQEQRFFMYDTIRVESGKNHTNEVVADTALCVWITKYATPELTQTLESLFRSLVLTARNLFVTCGAFRRWVADKLALHYPVTHTLLLKSREWRDTATNSSLVWSALQTLEIYEFNKTIRASLFLVYRLFYPIVDKGPLDMSHSIKLPFSIHTTTRNIALPIDHSFMESRDKEAQIVTLEALYMAHAMRRDLPPLFTKGVALLQEWLAMYPK